jgi:hypothetical protein
MIVEVRGLWGMARRADQGDVDDVPEKMIDGL